jgi:hypothetical protein
MPGRIAVFFRDGPVVQLIRIMETGDRTRQHRWTQGSTHWSRDNSLDWSGIGGSADWEPISRQQAELILKEHDGPDLFA